MFSASVSASDYLDDLNGGSFDLRVINWIDSQLVR